MADVQKLRQKSQSNNLEMSFGALAIMLSLIPNFPISNMINAATKAIYIKAESSVIK